MIEKIVVTHPDIQKILDANALTRGSKIKQLIELYRKEKVAQSDASNFEVFDPEKQNARLKYIQLALKTFGIDILRIEENMTVSN